MPNITISLAGLVSRVVPVKELVPEAMKIAEKISSHSKLIVKMCKECVNQAYELTLTQGLQVEKRAFHATFATVSYNFSFYYHIFLSSLVAFNCY